MGRHRLLTGRRLAGSAIVVLSGLLLGVLLAPRLISQDHSRALVATLVAKATGARTRVEGPITVRLLPRPSLSIEGLQLRSAAQGYRARLRQLSLTLALGPLIRGRLAVDELRIAHAAVTLDLGAETVAPVPIPELGALERLQARIEDLRLDLRLEPQAPEITAHLADLELSKDALSDRLSVQTRGTVAGQPFSLRAALDRVSELSAPARPVPLMVEISAAQAHLRVKGTVIPAAQGTAVDLQLSGEAPQAGALLRLAGLPSPELGPVRLRAHLAGPAAAPRLSQIALSLTRPPGVTLQAHGSIDDLWTIEDVDIRFSAHLSDPTVLSTLHTEGMPPLSRLDLQGSLRRRAPGGLWRIQGLDGQLETPQGLSVQLSGSTGLSLQTPGQPITDMALKVRLSAPNTMAARPLLFEQMPELGPVYGTMRLAASADALAVEDIDLHIGEETRIALAVRGRIARIPLSSDTPSSGIALDLQLRAVNTQQLARALDYPLPELGPIAASGHLSGSVRRSELQALSVRVGSDKSLVIEGQGWVRMADLRAPDPIERLEIKLQARADTTRAVSRVLGRTLPELGPVSLSTLLTGDHAGLRATELKLVWGRPSGLRVRGEGEIGHLSGTKPQLRAIHVQVDARAPHSTSLRHLVELRGLPEVGPLHARFSLTGTSSRLRIHRLALDVGTTASLRVKARGEIERIEPTPVLKWQGLRLQLELTSPSTRALARLLGHELPDLGALRGSARLTGGGRSMALEDIRLTVGTRSRPLLVTTGQVGDLLHLDALALRTRIDIPYRKLLKPAVRAAFPEDARIEGELKLSRRQGILGAERFTLHSSATPTHSFYLRGTLRDLKGLNGLDAKIDFQARDAATLGLLLGRRWPRLPSLSGSGTVQGTLGKARFEGELRLGRTQATTQALLSLGQPRPRLQGSFRIPKLYLADFRTPGPSTQPTPAPPSPMPEAPESAPTTQPLFSRAPIGFERLHLLDLSLSLAVDQVIGVKGHVGDLHASVTLEDGQLAVRPARLVYQGGAVAFQLGIDTRGKTPHQSLELTADALSLGQLLGELEQRPPASGTLGVSARLSTSGRSPHQMASNLNGDLDLLLVDGKLLQTYMSLFVGNYLRWAITATIKPRSYSNIACGAIGLVAKEGKVESTLLYVDGDDLSMRGKLSLDLAQETIEAVLLPKPKRSFWAVANPVRLSGPILNPTVQALSTQSAVNAIGTVGGLVVAPYLYLANKISGALWDKSAKKKRKKRIQACLKRAGEEADKP